MVPMKTGRIYQWPLWTEYEQGDRSTSTDPDYVSARTAIVEAYGPEKLKEAWLRVCEQLQTVTEEIIGKGNNIIPVCSAAQLLKEGFSSTERERIWKTGCVVIRGVIPEASCRQLYADLRDYIADNREHIVTWPEESPSMYKLFNSPTQNIIRSHPTHLHVQRLLNELWHDNSESGETSPDPLIYLGGLRDRPPNQVFLGLGPHIDAGSLSRWADPKYREFYKSIFSGHPEDHDSWDLNARKDVVQDLFKGGAHSSVMRSFQGWTALTPAAPREGSILLYPNVKTTIGYWLLRPFFCPPADEVDIMDASKWKFDNSGTGGYFPGTMKPDSQRLSRSSHPHLRLRECLVHAPDIQPGDTVWWHPDLCHAVDPIHEGSQNSSVVFIPACPTTPMIEEYVKRQLADTLAGRQPFDSKGELDESKLKGYRGLEDLGLSDTARKAFGYDL
ncbi:hypothetical protein ABW20_dc0101765 [Dactylellina cionopaga]|nr:hypothetical protein ABW20_dc0101765 [Dactylellina cionopaga]